MFLTLTLLRLFQLSVHFVVVYTLQLASFMFEYYFILNLVLIIVQSLFNVYVRKILTNTCRVLVNNSFKESFYEKRKKN